MTGAIDRQAVIIHQPLRAVPLRMRGFPANVRGIIHADLSSPREMKIRGARMRFIPHSEICIFRGALPVILQSAFSGKRVEHRKHASGIQQRGCRTL
ncbi:MAG: hypothetical protein AUJ92_06210 [Armatimonadetes bacterium CG2_30_59_28]|nr:MAG: hypothetical protein AUJ92_06210 [Armatimonadetes bacterium CG2_30_59_28]PIU66465.1 MAG: hypothetical protein COS85_04665 [Armatimonadetes bacterium CG07_land_8_20_14_0_80_59_28]